MNTIFFVIASPESFLSRYQLYYNTKFTRLIYQYQKTNLHQSQKDCHHGNLSFACLQLYKGNCLNIVADNHKLINYKNTKA